MHRLKAFGWGHLQPMPARNIRDAVRVVAPGGHCSNGRTVLLTLEDVAILHAGAVTKRRRIRRVSPGDLDSMRHSWYPGCPIWGQPFGEFSSEVATGEAARAELGQYRAACERLRSHRLPESYHMKIVGAKL